MPSIRIKEIPPGFAPAEIREEWIGVEIPLATEEELKANPPISRFGNANGDGYQVLTEKAIYALRHSGHPRAADFWEYFPGSGHYLVFAKNICELIP